MDVKEILTLIEAGYSKEEIEKMEAAAPAAPAAEPATEPAPAPASTPEPATEPEGLDLLAVKQELAAVKQELKESKKMLQTIALLRDSAPAPVDNANAAVEVLANIIRPSNVNIDK